MDFSQPYFIYLTLIMVPVVVVFLFWLTWQNRKDRQALGELPLVNKLLSSFSQARRIIKAVLIIAGLLIMALALAGPQYGSKMVEVHRQGVDVVIALDVSKSMLAEDIKPNRLERAKQELSTLIDRLHGDRVGVVAFAGQAQIACPLTTDYAAAKMFLSYLSPDQITVPGTDLGRAIQTAMTMYGKGTEGYRVLVLLTDGEDHEKQVFKVAEEAKQNGIKILSIGFGSPEGEPIPKKDNQGNLTGYVKDSNGKTVVTKLDEETLKTITGITKGYYIPAHHGILEADTIAQQIDVMQKKDISSGKYGASEDRYQFLLLPAIIILLIAFWLPIKQGAWLMLILLMVTLPQLTMAGTAEDVNKGNRYFDKGKIEDAIGKYRDGQIKNPDEPVVLYNLGNALQKKGEYEEAEKAYQKALKTKDKKLKSKTLYNLGNNYFEQQKYEDAVKAYKRTLKIDPKDEDALYNLAQALLLMKNPDMQKKQQQKKDKEKKEQQNQKAQAGQSKEDKDNKDDKKDNKDQSAQKGDEKNKGPDDKGLKEPEEKDEKQKEDKADNNPLPKPGEMSKDDAKNLLDSIREAEREAQKERMKNQGQQIRKKGQADW